MLDEILSVLRTNFSQYPPHTIQRLSELVLRPHQHYRNLVPYLHALDRVVHVTSGANRYPLPPALPDIGAMSLLANGVGGSGSGRLSIDTAAANSVASDEALGGALLTPIPWLTRRANGGGSDDGSDAGSSSPLSAGGSSAQQFQLQQQQQRQGAHFEGRVRTESTETIEGPNGIGSIETVSVSVNGIPSTGAGVALLTQRSVTQGELLRQEQRAGLVPMNQLSRQHQQQQQAQAAASGAAEEDATMTEDAGEAEDEIPHARGPEEIGPADTGPQSEATANLIASGGGPMDVQGIDVEAAVGRRLQSPPTQQQQERASVSSPGGGDLIPRSPKREAADSLEPESPAKRRRDDEAASTQDQDPPAAQEAEAKSTDNSTAASAEAAGAEQPKPDAEGDVVLPDATAAETVAKAAQEAAAAAADEPKAEGESTAQDGKPSQDETEGKAGGGVSKVEQEKPADAPVVAHSAGENQGG
jgi:hypothetical protein